MTAARLGIGAAQPCGGPATSAKVLLACHAVGTTLQWLVPDAAGRVERTLQRGRWTLLAMDDTGWASHELDGEMLVFRLR